MSENSVAAPIQVSVSVVGSEWVQHASSSRGTGITQVETIGGRLLFLHEPVILTEPLIGVGEPVPVDADIVTAR